MDLMNDEAYAISEINEDEFGSCEIGQHMKGWRDKGDKSTFCQT